MNNKLLNKITNGNCLELMKEIEDKSVNLILCDLPYGVLNNNWDSIIPFDKLWEQYNRIIKDNGAILLFGQQPFTSLLVTSNLKMYRYNYIWVKNNVTGFANAKKMPMKKYEEICVFYKKLPVYNPQNLIKLDKPIFYKKYENSAKDIENTINGIKKKVVLGGDSKYMAYSKTGRYRKDVLTEYTNYPNNLLYFDREKKENRIHSTQKPILLLEHLIKTYTNENDLVLDNCSGSGSTCIASHNTNRNFIGIELDTKHYNDSLILFKKLTNKNIN
jgi:site-specific DNA-methyltransferase (adenine-specific)